MVVHWRAGELLSFRSAGRNLLTVRRWPTIGLTVSRNRFFKFCIDGGPMVGQQRAGSRFAGDQPVAGNMQYIEWLPDVLASTLELS